jgi:glutamyl-tRNA synthetase
MDIVTRFAPSPTGMLHIGGARTAYFNWLFARRHGGKFHLRIEDTDRKRSTPEAVTAILESLQWLGLDWDGETIFQFARAARHAEMAHAMVAAGTAYRDFTSPEEGEALKEAARKDGSGRVVWPWRDRIAEDAQGPCVIRLKAPLTGAMTIEDKVQGPVTVQCETLDDLVLLRSDGTPTYMLSVVVDDHDMGVTHVIRGDDHLTNAFRQRAIYEAMGWEVPVFAHVPLIHGQDGAKLSKRHGALGTDAYRDMGFLPEALANYLLRLGWAHGDEEIIPRERAVEVFDLEGIGRAAPRLDLDKLAHVNAHYLRAKPAEELARLVEPFLSGRPDDAGRKLLVRAMPMLAPRAKTLIELAKEAGFLLAQRPILLDDKAAETLAGAEPGILGDLADSLKSAPDFSTEGIESAIRSLADAKGLKLGKVAPPLRAAVCGSLASPPIFEVCALLGRDETLARLEDAGVKG